MAFNRLWRASGLAYIHRPRASSTYYRAMTRCRALPALGCRGKTRYFKAWGLGRSLLDDPTKNEISEQLVNFWNLALKSVIVGPSSLGQRQPFQIMYYDVSIVVAVNWRPAVALLLHWVDKVRYCWSTVCSVCGFVVKSNRTSNGTFTSPNYPGRYPRNTECHYLFYGNDNEKIHITFPYFDVEGIPPQWDTSDLQFTDFYCFTTRSSVASPGFGVRGGGTRSRGWRRLGGLECGGIPFLSRLYGSEEASYKLPGGENDFSAFEAL